MKIRQKKLKTFTLKWVKEYTKFHNDNLDVSYPVRLHLFCSKHGIEMANAELPKTPIGKMGGTTNGKLILIDFQDDNPAINYFVFWHEFAHYHLHFDNAGKKLSRQIKEQEADIFATYMCNAIMPGNYDIFIAIARDNPGAAMTPSERIAMYLEINQN